MFPLCFRVNMKANSKEMEKKYINLFRNLSFFGRKLFCVFYFFYSPCHFLVKGGNKCTTKTKKNLQMRTIKKCTYKK